MRFPLPIVLVLAFVVLAGPAQAAGSDWRWPLGESQVARDFEAPEHRYGPGHRGVDLAGTPGATVRTVASGTVSFVGDVAGTPVVTVTHGRERSTYQPVAPEVEVGDAVDQGDRIGTLIPGHAGCGAPACLHLGRVDGDTYLNPLELLGAGGRFRLVDPEGPLPRPPALGSGEFAPPVIGPVTSSFGRRIHPVTGVVGLHDGIDLAAPCGTGVEAAAEGMVRSAGLAGAYGLRVEVEHPDGRVTSYSHLSSVDVAAGARLVTGDRVGRVGSTGSSTGCHLHFSLHVDGSPVDPAPLL